MNISIAVVQILGIFFVIVGVSMIFNRKSAAVALGESVQNKGILWMWGFLAVIIGAIVVVLNNTWTYGLPLLVTILGWLALVKGTFILLFPNAAGSLYGKFSKSGLIVFCGIVLLILGLVLLYFGYYV